MLASDGWDSFDVQSATTLYWKPISFLVRQPDREEHVCELIVRILSGFDRTDHSSRVSIFSAFKPHMVESRDKGLRVECS